jgi:hypothetical protein
MRRNDRGQKREPDAFFSLTSDQFMVLDRLLDVLGLFACFWCISTLLGLAWHGMAGQEMLADKMEKVGWVDG